MQQVMTKELAEKLGLTWRQKELDALTDAELRAGYVKFFSPSPPNLEGGGGEIGWAWVNAEDRAKYDDDQYTGKLTAILCEDLWHYGGLLRSGVEVVLQCIGEEAPMIDPEWVQEKLVDSGLYEMPERDQDSTGERAEEISRRICELALETWGAERQTKIVYEKTDALLNELRKPENGEDNTAYIADAIAGLEIALAQMKILHDCEQLVEVCKARKLERLARIISEEEEKPLLPELTQYDEAHCLFIPNDEGLDYPSTYEVIFDVGEPVTRYYCSVEAKSITEALGVFFKAHPHITYDMVYEHTEVGQ